VAVENGDYLVRRSCGLFAYHLAVVVDDFDQGITEVVRGADLLSLTPVHLHLQGILGLPSPRYMHVPMAVSSCGDKLSKQTGAPALDQSLATDNLLSCLEFLGQKPPYGLKGTPVSEIWAWSRENWNPEALRGQTKIAASGHFVGNDRN
jgi:glutamyl-Q tRNA(Asp) synthetase